MNCVARWLAILTVNLLTSLAHAQPPSSVNWPHLRGPAYDGHSSETHLIDAWPESGPPVLWVRELGQGYSGFVAGDGRLFTQFQTPTRQYVIALDPDSGAELWRRRVGWAWQPAGAYPGPFATPTFHASRVYYATPAGVVGCLDALDGHELWSVDTPTAFVGRGTEFGFAATPLVEDGKVIVPVGGPEASVVALDAATGRTVWAAGSDPASYCPALPVTLDGRRLVVAYLRNTLVLHDLATGRILQRQVLSRDYDEHSAWPLYAAPDLLISAPFRNGSRLLRLKPDGDAVTAQDVWANKALSVDVCSAVVMGGNVYGFDVQQYQSSAHRPSRGAFKCLDLASGTVRWETEDVRQCSILAADGKLILLDETGHLILARPNADRYTELARYRVFESWKMCWTPPALWGKRLFLRDHEKAVCLYLGSPDALDPNRERIALPRGEGRFDWSRLLTREPDYPNDAPNPREVGRWFAWCVGLFGLALAPAGLAVIVAWRLRSVAARRVGSVVFALTALHLGLAGTTLIGTWRNEFVLTWPMVLYVVFRATVGMGEWARDRSWRSRLAARAMIVALLAMSYGYFELCRAVGYVMAWGFLCGFVPAVPAVAWAARAKAWRTRLAADALGFSLFFWLGGLVPYWRG